MGTVSADDLFMNQVRVQPGLFAIRQEDGEIRLGIRIVEHPVTIVNRSPHFMIFIILTLDDP